MANWVLALFREVIKPDKFSCFVYIGPGNDFPRQQDFLRLFKHRFHPLIKFLLGHVPKFDSVKVILTITLLEDGEHIFHGGKDVIILQLARTS